MKAFLRAFGIGALVIGGIILFFSHQSTPPPTAPPAVQTNARPAPLVVAPVAPPTAETPPSISSTRAAQNPPPSKPARSEIASVPPPQTPPLFTPPPQSSRGGKAPILDPTAREALSFVGADADAEAYWFDAINDPTLPAQERQDLIEDLNEDGLSDPDHPGPQDLPLIENRLLILRELAYDPMDKVNFDAIQEAAKDLNKMYADLTGN